MSLTHPCSFLPGLLQDRSRTPQVRQRVKVPLNGFEADFMTFTDLADSEEHIALGLGDWKSQTTPQVRIHSECLTGDVFQSSKCDCGDQLHEAVQSMALTGGILLYLRQEGRGIGLYNKLDAYALQAQGYDTYEANRRLGLRDDLRNYQVAAQMLGALGIAKIRLLSNNPDKAAQLRREGIGVVEEISTGIFLKPANQRYLEAKVRVTGHRIELAHV